MRFPGAAEVARTSAPPQASSWRKASWDALPCRSR